MIFVDPLFNTDGLTPKWPYKQACHMFCDSLTSDVEELHRIAERIGLQRNWFQNQSRLPHYDLTASRRRVAISCGAVPCDRRKLAEVIEARENYRNGWKSSERLFSPKIETPIQGLLFHQTSDS